VIHLPTKISKEGFEIPRVKTVFGFAHPMDGRLNPNPPQVSGHGAGPQNVKFWLNGVGPAGAGVKSAKKPADSLFPSNTYISVFDYFKKSKPFVCPIDHVELT